MLNHQYCAVKEEFKNTENTKRFQIAFAISKSTKTSCRRNLYSMMFSKNGELFFILPSKVLSVSTTTTSVLVVFIIIVWECSSSVSFHPAARFYSFYKLQFPFNLNSTSKQVTLYVLLHAYFGIALKCKTFFKIFSFI